MGPRGDHGSGSCEGRAAGLTGTGYEDDGKRMADNNDTGDKKLTVGGGKTLSLKRPIETGIVKQSFSHGRTNAVSGNTMTWAAPGVVAPRASSSWVVMD